MNNSLLDQCSGENGRYDFRKETAFAEPFIHEGHRPRSVIAFAMNSVFARRVVANVIQTKSDLSINQIRKATTATRRRYSQSLGPES
jgi:hypothetical protein